jgi:AhpD family alkylhydroperoxidase
MLRISTPSAHEASWFTRLTYWYARRRYGRLPGALGVLAQNPGIMRAVAGFELLSARARNVDKKLKLLAEVRVATLVGCRYCLDIGSAIARGAGDFGAAAARARRLRDEPRLRAGRAGGARLRDLCDLGTL